MSFMHPALAWLAALAVIPVILHFLLRAKPKKLFFPALRLIQNRRRQNVQRMRLRHLWLLLLRMLVIVGIVFAIARPRVPPANYTPTAAEIGTLLAIVLLAVGAYFAALTFWRRQRLPQHVFAHRRTFLRGGVSLAALILLLLLVVWPFQKRIAAEVKSPEIPVDSSLPVSAVLLFDTSLSMQYRHESRTRLDIAREIAAEHVRKLPSGSRLAVADTASSSPILFQADLAATLSRIEDLSPQPLAIPLDDRIRAALDLQRADRERVLGADASVPEEQRQDRFLREVYIFTDLAASAWRQGDNPLLKEQLAALPMVNLYIVDVGVTNPLNVGISSSRLSDSTLAQGSELIVEAAVQATGYDELQPTVELFVENEAGKLVKQGRATVELKGGEGAVARFSIRGLTGPVRQGELRLVSSDDPLPFDDVRYFTLEVRPPQEILVVAASRDAARFWMEALAPSELRRLGAVRYRCTYISSANLREQDLRKYSVVCLIDVPTLNSATWTHLARFVESGGGVAVILGGGIDVPGIVSYNSEEAQAFLPATLLGAVNHIPPQYLDLQNLMHPLLKKFADWGATALTSVEIAKYWKVEPVAGASVIAPYTDPRSSPALLERSHGRGRTVMFTTSVSRDGWNELPVVWAFLAFADQTVRYLSQQSQGVFNYTAGEDVIVPLDETQPLQRYLLRKPSLQQLPGEVSPGQTAIVVPHVDQLGQYRVLGAEENSRFERGFSVNPASREEVLTPLTDEELNGLLGEGRYSRARTIEELDRTVRTGRIGREIFPFALLVMLVAFCAEHFVANRFYEVDQPTVR